MEFFDDCSISNDSFVGFGLFQRALLPKNDLKHIMAKAKVPKTIYRNILAGLFIGIF